MSTGVKMPKLTKVRREKPQHILVRSEQEGLLVHQSRNEGWTSGGM